MSNQYQAQPNNRTPEQIAEDDRYDAAEAACCGTRAQERMIELANDARVDDYTECFQS